MASVSLTGTVSAAYKSGYFTYELINDGTEAEIVGYSGPGGEVEIPEDVDGYEVTSIGKRAFYKDPSLISITIPDNVTSIGQHAFYKCDSLNSVTIGDNVTTIGHWAFEHCTALTFMAVGDNVTAIGNYAFSNCYKLTSVTIPSKVTSIGDCAFQVCTSLTSVTIPGSVTTIGSYAFYGCSSLVDIDVDESNENYAGVDGVLYSKDGTTLIQCPAGKSGEFTIPDGVTAIGDNAVMGCNALTSVTMGDGVASIGSSSFSGCRALTSVTLGDGVAYIANYAFSGCFALTSINIPSSVAEIGSYAFSDCINLTSVTLMDGVVAIADGAFSGCSALTSISIPGSVTDIGGGAFSSCSSLTEIEVDESNENYASIGGALYSKSADRLIKVPEGTAGSFTIPDSVTTIADGAFSGCSALTSVTMGDGIITIADGAFSGCSALTYINIPGSVAEIESYAFHGCVNLTAIIFHGDAPTAGDGWNFGSDKLTIYYYRDATGFATPIWSDTYCYPLSEIAGTVRDADDTPIPGATIRLNTTASTTTNESGVFTLDGLLPGTYTLTIVKDGYVTIEQEVEVLKGEDQALGTLNMELSADPTTPPKDGGPDSSMFLIVGAVAAIAVAIAAVLWMRRKSLP